MINIQKSTAFKTGSCLACTTKRDENNEILDSIVYSISLSKDSMSHEVHLCSSCTKELVLQFKNRFNIVGD